MVQDNDERVKKLVKDVIAQKCADSSHDTLRKIHHAIHIHGNKLEAVRLSGGNINYTYKVFVVNQQQNDPNNSSELQYPTVFAKLSLDHMLFLPIAKLDLQRVNNEYQILKKLSHLVPESVVMPLGCWDIMDDHHNQQITSYTEWFDDSTMLSKQFMKRNVAVDPCIALKLADIFATLHTFQISILSLTGPRKHPWEACSNILKIEFNNKQVSKPKIYQH